MPFSLYVDTLTVSEQHINILSSEFGTSMVDVVRLEKVLSAILVPLHI